MKGAKPNAAIPVGAPPGGAPARVDSNSIPVELTALPQWVNWRLVNAPGKKKRTKQPLNPRTLAPASIVDPRTWATFGEALEVHDGRQVDGIGFVFTTQDPYVGVDLDHCRDPVTGIIEPWALEIISLLATYSEVSISLTGIHLICKGELPPGGRRKGNFEMYAEGRYFVVTGHHLDGTPVTIEERPDQLLQLHRQVFGAPSPICRTGPAPGTQGLILGDGALVKRARQARNGKAFSRLWQGDHTAHPSHSEADLALCSHLAFWTNGDPTHIDSLFRQSGLIRSKWDERHGSQTYGERTIATALNGSRGGVAMTVIAPAANPPDSQPERRDFPLTDAGNAELFAHLYGDRMRFDHTRGAWLLWRGHHWAYDADGEVMRLAKEAVRTRYRLAEGIEDIHLRQKTATFAIASESRQRQDAFLALARSERSIADAGTSWDSDPWLLGAANGVVDLRDAKLREGQLEDRITLHTPISYDPAATCPRWRDFLHQVFCQDQELISFIQRAMGYSLTGSVAEQILLLCHGTGSNGKTVFLTILRKLGGGYAMNIPFNVLELQQRGSITNDLAALHGRRVVTSSETNESTRLNEARVKALTGGDPITARFLYHESFTFEPVAKLWLAVNHLPLVRDDSIGFWRRVRVIPFLKRFSGNDADKGLVHKLEAELPGILAWAIQGALDWQRMGLNPPASIKRATDAYQEDSDELAQFIGDRCVEHDQARVRPAELYSTYQRWAEEQGIPMSRRLNSNVFARRMGERFTAKKSNGSRFYQGIGLATKDRVE